MANTTFPIEVKGRNGYIYDQKMTATQNKQEWVDQRGTPLFFEDVLAIVMRATGATEKVLDHIRVGGIYQNGTLWFQRLEAAKERAKKRMA